MIILDTNVVSELMRPRPDDKVIGWLDRQPRTSIWTTSVTVFETYFGLEAMPAGMRRETYAKGFENFLVRIEHRIASFHTDAARCAGALMASWKLLGRPRELRDTMIAGIVLAHRATLATRNTRDFADIPATVIDPWAASV